MRDNPFGFEFKQGVSRHDMLEHQQKADLTNTKGKSINDWVKGHTIILKKKRRCDYRDKGER